MPLSERSAYHLALQNFSHLPDYAYVALPVVCALFACSPATVWRRVRDGLLVQPVKLGKRTTRWQVGMLRKALEQTTTDQYVQGGKE